MDTPERIGYLDGGATSLWIVCGDAVALAAWTGQDGPDFERALELMNDDDGGPIAIGDVTGRVVDIGECGGSAVWRIEGGVALWTFRWALGVDRESADVRAELGRRVATLPAGDVHVLGRIDVPSGCLGLLVGFAPGVGADAVRAAAEAGAPQHLDNERVLVPVPAGTYEITDELLAPSWSTWHDDELGRYRNRIRIVRVG